MSGAVATLEGWDCHPEEPGLAGVVACGNVMRFKKTEFKVLCLGQDNLWYQSRLGMSRSRATLREGFGGAGG